MSKRLLLLGLVAALSVVVGFLVFTPPQAVAVVRRIGYWVILAEFALFMVYLGRSLWRSPWSFEFKRDGGWLIFLLAATAFLHVHEAHEIKIMADEAVINSTALNMHFNRDSTMLMRAFDVGGNFIPTVVFLDKRPLFFPFLVSLVHDLTGYRFANVFVLNAILSVLLVTLTFFIGRKLAGNKAGGAAVLLMISIPLVAQNVTGAGFEILNMVMILSTILLGMRLLEQPTDDRLSVFVFSAVLLAQTRYESVVFLAPVTGTILYLWIREKSMRLPPTLIIAPMLLILCPLQHNVFKVSESSWQLSDVPGASSVFSIRYFYDNVGHALAFFFSFDGTQPSSWLVALLGIIGGGLTILVIYKQHKRIFAECPAQGVWIIFFVGLAAHTVFMLCYFWGKWDDPIIRRLSLPCHILLIFSFIGVVAQLISSHRRWRYVSVGVLAYIFAFTIPASAAHRFSVESVAGRVANWINDFAKRQNGRKVLAFDWNNGAVWLLNRQASMTAFALTERLDQFLYHYKVHTFDDIYVVQRITVDLKSGAMGVAVEDDLGPAFKLETVEERKFGVGYFCRVARVVSFDEERLRAWQLEVRADRKLPVTERTRIKLERVSEKEWFDRLP
jgi:hypothetical protein